MPKSGLPLIGWGAAFFGGIMSKERIRVRLKGLDAQIVDSCAKTFVDSVGRSVSKVSGPISLPTRINKFTVLRSPN